MPHDLRKLELSDEQEQELRRLFRYYGLEAKRCEKAKAYLAGCVMAAGSMEAALILMVNAFSQDIPANAKLPSKRLLKWDLAQLLVVAKMAGWLPAGLDVDNDEWIAQKAQVGDRAEVVRLLRNLLHPGRYVDDHHRQRVTKKYLKFAFDVAIEVVDSLFARIEKSVLERAKAEE